ncbi:MAG: hypothetical protein [Bacteriophage sp.]|nr:MAG: hypothetical protein [Bacteriophage sp.]
MSYIPYIIKKQMKIKKNLFFVVIRLSVLSMQGTICEEFSNVNTKKTAGAGPAVYGEFV